MQQKNDLIQDASALVAGQYPAGALAHGVSRRDALLTVAGLGLAYTMAAGPVMAQTAVQTPAEGLIAGFVQIDAQGFSLPAYRAAPADKRILPVVLVVQEIFGIHAYIADVCRRLAHAGYLAIAPALYARVGDPAQYTDMSRLISELVSKVPDAQVLADLDATAAWAAANGGDADKMAVTGFCWGGRIVWLYAAHGAVKAGAAWYGRLVGQQSTLAPRQPVDLAGTLQAPVLGLYGGQDSGIPVDTVEQMRAALAQGSAAARASDIVVYPDAPHGFHADYRPSFRPDAAADGWARMLDWFKHYGVAGA